VVFINNYLLRNYRFKGEKRMICPKCGGDTFIMVSDVGLKCENCGYIYSMEGKK
jgi:ribosomal protein S27AE